MTDPELIFDAVTSDITLAQLIGGRIYPVVLPEEPEMPAITYGLVSQPTEVTQDGAQYRWPRWRFRIYSLKYADLVPVAKAIAAIFGDRTVSPLPSSRIEYPASTAEGQEIDTHRYWRSIDVIAFDVAGGAAQ